MYKYYFITVNVLKFLQEEGIDHRRTKIVRTRNCCEPPLAYYRVLSFFKYLFIDQIRSH